MLKIKQNLLITHSYPPLDYFNMVKHESTEALR